MLLPGFFGDNLFNDMDELMRWPERKNFFGNQNMLYDQYSKNLMKTDIKEKDDLYEIDMDLPGYGKDDIQATLQDGYLTINAEKNEENSDKDEDGNYIRRERYSGSCTRRFYVGDAVEQDDISARFEDGILHLDVRKKEPEKLEAKSNRILIEG